MIKEEARDAIRDTFENSEYTDELIKTLEQEPRGDAISREAVLKLQYRIDDSATLSSRDVVNVEDIQALPPLPPQEPRWIPVSERLPKFADVYRVTRYYPKNVMNPNYLVDACFFDGSNWYNDNRINHERYYATNVIAWQENPEPYKVESQERRKRMPNEEIIEQLENAIELIKQDGKDWLDDRDIPILEACIKSLTVLDKIRSEITAIAINGQVDEHTAFIRTGEQVKQMALDIIGKYQVQGRSELQEEALEQESTTKMINDLGVKLISKSDVDRIIDCPYFRQADKLIQIMNLPSVTFKDLCETCRDYENGCH